jgi:hypothetical protein
MVRLFLGLIAASILLYGSLHFIGQHHRASSGANASSLSPPRTATNDLQRIQTQSRAALDRTIKSSAQ